MTWESEMITKYPIVHRWALQVLVALMLPFGFVCSAAADSSVESEETMLMFVGETRPVATVASRTPEEPITAPAMVNVVTREEIARRGYRTLAELLADQPGFFMAAAGRGTVPYLRGLRDSVLFLYDGVPLTTDVTKSFAPLDREISLFAVDRVEIVRGPGSVLWGPDAFSGVVNIVPRTGRQQRRGEVGLLAGNKDLLGAAVASGGTGRDWEGFLTLSGARERFWQPEYLDWQPDGDTRSEEVEPSTYAEAVGTLKVSDWLHLSGRWSDYNRRFTMRNIGGDISWEGERDTPVNQVKATLSKIIGASHYSLSGYYQETDYRLRDSDIERAQRNRVLHGELLWDRRVLSRGLLTVGASWRRNAVDGALVRDGFLPEFLSPETPIFTPAIEQADFENTLASVFGQFRHQWRRSEWWAGLRYDDHSQYDNTLSYSLGFQAPLSEKLHFKAAYGTAFRSPYSSQLFENQSLEPESVRTVSSQFSWLPAPDRFVEMTLFHSRVNDHRAEDPYGGLSLPADRELYGLEIAAQMPVTDDITVAGNISVNDGNGTNEKFSVQQFCFVRPDGSRVCTYDQWEEPVDRGPRWMVKLNLNWRIGERHNLDLGASMAEAIDYSYRKGEVEGDYSQPLLVDLCYRRPGVFSGRDVVTLRLTNLFDRDYRQPDIYGPIEAPPFRASLFWQMNF